MLLAANRESTGIGVRPRGNRVEITADFTPDASLMIATATAIVGIVRQVMTWPSFELSELDDARRFRCLQRLRAGRTARARAGWRGTRGSPTTRSSPTWTTRLDDGRRRRCRCARSRGRVTVFLAADRALADPLSLRLIDA